MFRKSIKSGKYRLDRKVGAMDKVRIAIVGCGNISQLNVPGYLQHPNCEVVALCDNAPGRAEARAKQWGISPRIYTDYEQVSTTPNVDAVELLTPPQHHATMTVDGLDAGKHVSCQKPMCTSVAEADVMVAAARRAKTKFRMTEKLHLLPHHPQGQGATRRRSHRRAVPGPVSRRNRWTWLRGAWWTQTLRRSSGATIPR